eukprot:1524985-Amphidinium_carterae.1
MLQAAMLQQEKVKMLCLLGEEFTDCYTRVIFTRVSEVGTSVWVGWSPQKHAPKQTHKWEK